MKYEFRTQLSLDECVNKLQDAIAGQPDPSLYFYKTISGKVDRQGFSLCPRRFLKDYYSPTFQGEFISAGGQTILRGDFNISNGVKVILIVWCLFWFMQLCVILPVSAAFIIGPVASMGESLQMPPESLSQFLVMLVGYTCLSLSTALAVNAGLFLYLRHDHRKHRERISNWLSGILGVQAQ
jgi:hypothetical protein